MSDDTPNIPLDGAPERSSGADESTDATLHRKAWTWLNAQVDRLGRDPDIVPLLPREEVEASVRPQDLKALTSRTRHQLGVRAVSSSAGSSAIADHAPRRSGIQSQTGSFQSKQHPTRARPSSWQTAAMAGGLVLLLLAGLWAGGRLTQPATQPLASLTPYQDALAFVAAPPTYPAKSLTDGGVRDLRAGVQALQAAAPHPLAPAPRYDASRAQDAATALAAAHRALASQPPSTLVSSSLFAVSRDAPAHPLRDDLDTMGDLAAFAALLAAKAHLMQGDAGTAEEWLRRVRAGTPWHDAAQQLRSQVSTLSRPG